MSKKRLISEINKYKGKLLESDFIKFPEKGGVKKSKKQGVYIIYYKDKKVLHVVKTNRAKYGIDQRLTNHLYGNSSFTIKYLKKSGIKLREKQYSFRYIEINDEK